MFLRRSTAASERSVLQLGQLSLAAAQTTQVYLDPEVMRQSMKMVYKNEQGKELVLVPEAWQFMPNLHGEITAVHVIRQTPHLCKMAQVTTSTEH